MLYALNDSIDLFYTPSEIIEGKNGQKPQVGQRLHRRWYSQCEKDQESLAVSLTLSIRPNGYRDLYRYPA